MSNDTFVAPNGDWITISDKFVYEISFYKILKNRLEYYGSKFLYLDYPLTIKRKSIYNYKENYIVGKFIDWLKAPKDYIINNKLPKLKLNVRKCRRAKKV